MIGPRTVSPARADRGRPDDHADPCRPRATGGDLPVSILVLSESDVRSVLDMPSCVDAMELTLAGLQRGELSMPLRFVVRPPTDRGEPVRSDARSSWWRRPAVLAEGDRRHSRELRPRDRSPPGIRAVARRHRPDGCVAVVNASAITEIRTAAVSGVATRLLARKDCAAGRDPRFRGARRSHVDAMRAVIPDAEITIWSRTPDHAVALANASGAASPKPSRRRSPMPTSSAPRPRRASRSCDRSGSRLART